jgi:hypothetical protein
MNEDNKISRRNVIRGLGATLALNHQPHNFYS